MNEYNLDDVLANLLEKLNVDSNPIAKEKNDLINKLRTTKNDDETRQILSLIYKQKKLEYFDYRKIYNLIPESLKVEVFNNMLEKHSQSDTNIIDSYYVKSILEQLPENDREKALLQILNLRDNEKEKNVKENGKRTGIFSYYFPKEIIKLIPNSSRLNIIKGLKRYMDETGEKINPEEILAHIPQVDFKESAKLLLIDDPYKISNIITSCAKENGNLEFYIDTYLSLQSEEGKSLIKESDFAGILEKFPEEVQEKEFFNYILNKKVFSFEKTIIHMNTLAKYQILDASIPILLNRGNTKEALREFINRKIINRNAYVGYPDGTKLYPNINDIYTSSKELNSSNFNKLIKKFGYQATNFLDNRYIEKSLKMDEDSFQKYLNLFNLEYTNLNNNDINTICNALLQREFRMRKKDDYNIFSTIESLLNSKETSSKKKTLEILAKISQYINLNNYTHDEIEAFIAKLYNHDKDAINTLHNITNAYIASKREEYSKERLANIYEELNLKKKITKQCYKKKYLEKKDYANFRMDTKFNISSNTLNDAQKELLENQELAKKIYAFKKNPQEVLLEAEEKSSLKVFESIFNLLYENQVESSELEDSNTIYEYEPFKIQNEQLLGIMANIDPDVIKTNILPNDNLYTELSKMLKKYHLLGWGETFNPLFLTSDIIFEEGTIANIISYFNEIYPKIENSNTILTKLIDYGNIYDGTPQVYKILLGKEDYTLIALNDGKNKASMPKNERLEQVPGLVVKMYEREFVTVPPMDEDLILTNKKKLNVVVGNSTSMNNLTNGERTDACLRIGGAFYDLFKYCLENENGFHIRFTNPQTNKFVSRVSGIRNGNTLFLNELRLSKDKNYNNEDLFEAIKMVAEQLINNSKNSSLPIDNIIITSDYALKDHGKEEQPLNIKDRDKALKGLNFNISQNGTGIILKTSNQDNSLVPYIFTDQVPKYKTQRDKIKIFKNKEADNKIMQIYMIDELLSNKDIDELTTEIPKHYKWCISSSDWFVAIDYDNKITKYLMKNTKAKEQATKELQEALSKLEQYKLDKNTEIINYGGHKR